MTNDANELQHAQDELRRRLDAVDEMLSDLIRDIGTGAGVAPLRERAVAIWQRFREAKMAISSARLSNPI